ncbi:SusC/RagA family TonB-linked outer membrane protein [Chitinophaga silvatica]|uniref:SusC/RagA family TonB-linked outer membrane protein n=1 Tax=Chitinophaga silvatica TaxID=2282649 RepID=A0A3E1Y2C2_9BACT|nr:SusC/RagA family TonB-linked outer membrane protein [Chitinophaga silvatica]RFS18803.1 SusC/RagA family TonB-linked outer membrane protein [Chitinophaga silvatica]
MKRKLIPPCKGAWHSYAFFLLLVFGLLMAAGPIYAQKIVLDTKVSYKANKKPLLFALKDIRVITKVRFTYNEDLIRRQPPVTIDVKDETLEQVLKKILGSELEFAENFGGIMIMPKYNPETPVNVNKLGYIINGRVVNSDGEPIPGVGVQAQTSRQGTMTGSDGLFSLLVEEGETMKFSQIGMKSVFIKPSQSESFLKVTMEAAPMQVQEVLVNGYQRIEPRLATGAYFKINAAEIMQPGVPTVDKMLQGKVPGLMIINNSGSVNAAPTMRLRGTSTFMGNAAPLWVVDGMIKQEPVNINAANLSGFLGGNYSLMGNAISGVNPYDIESITVLRDAAATSIYGVRAANGVIVITTKRGKPGPVEVTYNTSVTTKRAPRYSDYNLMNSAERIQFSKDMVADGVPIGQTNALKIPGSYEYLLGQLYAKQITEEDFNRQAEVLSSRNTDWFKLLFRNALSTSQNLSFSGGNGTTNYYISLGYLKDLGTAKLDENQRYTFSGKVGTMFGKRLRVDVNFGGNLSKKLGYADQIENAFNYAYRTSRTLDPYQSYPKAYSVFPAVTEPLRFNYLKDLDNNYLENNGHSISTSVQASYNIGKGWRLDHQTSFSVDAFNSYSYATDQSYYITGIRGWNLGEIYPESLKKQTSIPNGGLGAVNYANSLFLQNVTTLAYTRSLRQSKDQVYFNLGLETNARTTKGAQEQKSGFYPDRGMQFFPTEMGNFVYGKTGLTDLKENALGVYFATGYNINNLYTISANVRSDASNRFGQYSNQKFSPNYGFGFSWLAKNEAWLRDSKLISDLRLNASYGIQGNVISSVGPELIATYASGSNPLINIYDRPNVQLKSLPYPDLRWEKTHQYNAGLFVGFIDGRINADFNLYKKLGKDLVVTHDVAYENGVTNTFLNIGRMNNTGAELRIGVVPVKTRDIRLAINFTNSWNKNMIVDTTMRNARGNYLAGNANVGGKSIGSFYSYPYTGLDKEGLPTVKDGVYDMQESSKELLPITSYLVYSGQKLPKLQGGFSLDFSYKSFAVSAMFVYHFGNHIRLNYLYSNNGLFGTYMPISEVNVNKDMANRWRKPGDEQFTDIPALKTFRGGTAPYVYLPVLDQNGVRERIDVYSIYDYADSRVVSGSFLKCTNISASYTVPSAMIQRLKLKSLNLGLSVANPLTIASRKLKGQDPEIDGAGSAALPITPMYTGSVNLTF